MLCILGILISDLTECIDDESPALSAEINGKETVFRFPGKLIPEVLNAGSRCRSMSCAVDLNSSDGVDDTELENILCKNVELWKFSKGNTNIGSINQNIANNDDQFINKDNFSSNLNIPTIMLTPC